MRHFAMYTTKVLHNNYYNNILNIYTRYIIPVIQVLYRYNVPGTYAMYIMHTVSQKKKQSNVHCKLQ